MVVFRASGETELVITDDKTLARRHIFMIWHPESVFQIEKWAFGSHAFIENDESDQGRRQCSAHQ